MENTNHVLPKNDKQVFERLLAILVDSRDFLEKASSVTADQRLCNLLKKLALSRNKAHQELFSLLVILQETVEAKQTMSSELRHWYLAFFDTLKEDNLELIDQIIMHELRNISLLEQEYAYTSKSAHAYIDKLVNEITCSILEIKNEAEKN